GDASTDDLRRAVGLLEGTLAEYTRRGDRLEMARACYNLAASLSRGTQPQAEPAQVGPAHTGPAPAEPPHTGPARTGPTPAQPAHTGPAHTGPAPAEPVHPGPVHPGSAQAERAIALFERSLALRDRDLVPLEWAESATELARAWLHRPGGSSTQDRERAAALLTELAAVTPASPDHARRAWGLLAAAQSDLRPSPPPPAPHRQALAAAEGLYPASLPPTGQEAELVRTAGLPR